MLIYYQYYNNQIPDTVDSMWENPGGFKHILETERHLATRNKGKPGKGPHRDPRDFYVIFFTSILTVFFCIAGFYIGNNLGGGRGTVLGMVVGGLVGLFTGPRLVTYVTKVRSKRWQHAVKKQDKHKSKDQGPIIS